MQVKLLSADAKVPTKGSALSAGYDLYSASSKFIPKHSRALISTDISIALPSMTYGRIAPRSGLSVKKIDIGAGVVDADYRGPISVLLINSSNADYLVNKGDRIAQLIITSIINDPIDVVQDLDETVRGNGGFGSTGT